MKSKKNQNAMDRYSLTNLKNHFDISKNMKLKRNKSAFVRVGSRILHEIFIESVTESLKKYTILI